MRNSDKKSVFAIVVGLLVFSIVSAGAQSGSGTWAFFQLKAGQYFKYSMKSERGMAGWVSLKADDAGGGALNVTLSGKWAGDFSEVVKLKPKMSAQDFYFAIKDPSASNAFISLLEISDVLVSQMTWKDGFTRTKGSDSVVVKGSKTYLGITGFVATLTGKFLGKTQVSVYCVNAGFPLPLSAKTPGANDTFTLELVEKKG
jgi:hypothetical protein